MDAIHQELAQRDPVLSDLLEKHSGIRVMCVDPWECLVSFIVSANNNIPRIQRDLERIARAFGEPVGGERSTFPFPGVLEQESALIGLDGLGLGLDKGRKISWAAGEILSGRLDLESLVRQPCHRLVTDRLKALHGVGDKVANCIALFSLEQLDAFPGDTHVLRSLARHYRNIPKSVPVLRRWGQDRFGRYSGYAEAALFFDDFTRRQTPGIG